MSGKSYLPVLGDRGCPARHRLILRYGARGGLAPALVGSAGVSATRRGDCLLCRLPPTPLVLILPPSPSTPFPAGRGRFLVFLCKGLRPLHPRGWMGRGTGSTCVSATRRGLNPDGTCSPCPGGEDHLKRRSSSPPVPPLLGCRHCSRESLSVGFTPNRRLPCAGNLYGRLCKCRKRFSAGVPGALPPAK